MRRHLSYANVMATVAVFVALGGGAYAAVKLPARSVGTRQLRRGAVTKAKLARSAKRALRGPTGLAGAAGAPGAAGTPGALGATGPTGPTGAVGGVLPAGASLSGAYLADAGASAPVHQTPVSFGYRLAKPVTEQVVVPGGPSTAKCPGSLKDPAAAPGYVCLFAQAGTTTPADVLVYDTETENSGVTGHAGMFIYTTNGAYSLGTWALTEN